MTALATVARQLDRVRSPLVGATLGRSSALRHLLARRDARLALGAAAALFAALAVSVAAPSAWFLWGPLILGVPHVLADARYLVLSPYRRIALRRRDAVLVAGLVAFAAFSAPWLGAAVVLGSVALAAAPDRRSAALAAPPDRPAIVVAAGALAAGRGRRAAVLAAALVLAVTAWAWPVVTSYAVMHAHNLIALIALAALGHRRVGAGLLAGALAVTAAILAGALDPILPLPALDGLAGYVLPDAALAAWPPALCARVALSFVFLQGLHYAAWLRLIPAAVRPHGGMRGFGASLRALERDCTAPVVIAVALVAIALPALAVAREPQALRALYVQLAGGHAYLELAVLARWLAS
jgi:hypothetical protein